jgi:lipoprotein-releasing system ATP-binding protein
LHQYPSQLSIGECQRTAVVRALINQPRLLLADEPTGSLDAENAGQLAQLLIELNKEQHIALVIVTHSLELAGKMDKIYQLREGKLLLTKKIPDTQTLTPNF